MHHQRRLHRQRRAVAGIDALHLARDQAVGDVAEARAAVLLRDGRAEQAERAHLGSSSLSTFSSRQASRTRGISLSCAKRARAVAHHALFLGQVAVEVERVLPVEIASPSAPGRASADDFWEAAVDMTGSGIAVRRSAVSYSICPTGKLHRSRGAFAPESFGRLRSRNKSEGARDAGGPTDPRASASRDTEAERRARPGRRPVL